MMKMTLKTCTEVLRRTQRGESFFIPTLEPKEVELTVRRAGALIGVNRMRVTYGIHRGLFGVMVRR